MNPNQNKHSDQPPQIIDRIPSAEELADQTEKRDLLETTLSPDALKAVMRGAGVETAIRLNSESMSKRAPSPELPATPPADIEPYEASPSEQVSTPAELAEMRRQLRESGDL